MPETQIQITDQQQLVAIITTNQDFASMCIKLFREGVHEMKGANAVLHFSKDGKLLEIEKHFRRRVDDF